MRTKLASLAIVVGVERIRGSDREQGEGSGPMNGVAVYRKLVAMALIALSGLGALIATSARSGCSCGRGVCGQSLRGQQREQHGLGDHDGDGFGVGPDHRRQCSGRGCRAITPDGKRVYVADVGSGSVSVITTATGAVAPPIAVGKKQTTVAITPDGKHAYVTNTRRHGVGNHHGDGYGVGPHHRRQGSAPGGDHPGRQARLRGQLTWVARCR